MVLLTGVYSLVRSSHRRPGASTPSDSGRLSTTGFQTYFPDPHASRAVVLKLCPPGGHMTISGDKFDSHNLGAGVGAADM